MKLDRLRTRRIAAALGTGAVAAAASLVLATGVGAQTVGSEDPAPAEETTLTDETSTTSERPDPTTVYSPPTIEPEDPGVPGNEGSQNGDIG